MKFCIPFLPAFLLVLAPFAVAADDAAPILLDETAVKNLKIETVEATESDFEETAFALGRLAEIPSRHAVLSSRIPGRVVAIEVQTGDLVETGQILARVESRQPGNPPPIIDLKAPIGGLLLESHVRLGEPVEPDRELMDISDLREMLAIARVPEHLAARLKAGSQAYIRVAALGDLPLQGELIRFGTAADAESGTIDAVFRLPNPDLRMRPDMRAEFSIVLGRKSGVLSVPRAALQGDAAHRFVYVRHFELPNTFLKAPVQVGEVNDRFVEILAGVFPADDVVTRGAYSLSFVGGRGPSLKEALDAAHGHEHAEDGSELTASNSSHGHDKDSSKPDPHEDPEKQGPFWKYTSAVLLVLLLASLFGKRRGSLHP